MSIMQFRTSGDFTSDGKALYARFNSREYYPGEIGPLDGSGLEILIEKHSGVPFPISRVVNTTAFRFERTSAHARLAPRNLSVVRFIKRGTAIFRQFHDLASAEQGDFVITTSDAPLCFTAHPDTEGVSEMIFIVIPTPMICRDFAEYKTCLSTLPGNSGRARIAAGLLQLLLDESESVSRECADRLTNHFIEEIRGLIRMKNAFVTPTSVSDIKFREIQNYIELSFADTNLCVKRVADANNVSVRYACDLFKRRQTSIATYLWSYRLQRVRHWLEDERMAGYSIKELAHRAGFKSAAHLSQMFRREFACSPKDVRKSVVRT